MANTICAAFWHRTRQCFVPLTRDDLVNRVGHDLAGLSTLVRKGWIASTTMQIGGKTKVTVYQITPLGIEKTFQTKQVAA